MSLGLVVDRVQVFTVDSAGSKNWVFVKLTTRDGVIGWGECYAAPDRDEAIALLAGRLGEYLVGRSVGDIRHFARVAYLDIATKRGSMDFYCALSGLEAAMWDALGKSVGLPVHCLLGGSVRSRIRVYANGWSYNSNGADEGGGSVVTTVRRLVDEGFRALKFDPFPGAWREQLSADEERAAIALVASVREEVGSEVDLLIEGHRRFDTRTASRLARLLEPFDPFWFEEPVHSYDIPALRDIRRRTTIPIVSGEGLYTKVEFRDLLQARAVDIINPDVANCGGILELVEIAAMASAYGISVSPHNYNSTTLGLAATITASSLIPNFLITEYFVNFTQRGEQIANRSFDVRDGYIEVPQEPGLGVELDENALIEYASQPARRRAVRQVIDE